MASACPRCPSRISSGSPNEGGRATVCHPLTSPRTESGPRHPTHASQELTWWTAASSGSSSRWAAIMPRVSASGQRCSPSAAAAKEQARYTMYMRFAGESVSHTMMTPRMNPAQKVDGRPEVGVIDVKQDVDGADAGGYQTPQIGVRTDQLYVESAVESARRFLGAIGAFCAPGCAVRAGRWARAASRAYGKEKVYGSIP